MRIILIGASGHGKVCAEIAELNGYDEILFLDDNRKLDNCGKYPVVGIVADYRDYIANDSVFFVSIGNAGIRKRIQEEIDLAGGKSATLMHPKAVVSNDIEICYGSVVMAGVVINAGTEIGKGVIVNTSSSVDHDCNIGDYSHISVGSHICGTVNIGSKVWVGAGTTVSNNLKICDGVTIGAGAVVVKDIFDPGTYVGAPARKLY